MDWLLELSVYCILIIIAWIDCKTMEIPDRWNLLLAVCGVAAMFIKTDPAMSDRIIGACCISIPMYLMICLIPGSFGGGDVKLTFVMGFYLGWKKSLIGAYLACLMGGCRALVLLLSGKVKAGDGAHMAFGPALCMGFILANRYGEELLNWYLGLFL